MEYIIITIVSFLIGWNVSDNYNRFKLKRYVKAKMEEGLTDAVEVERIQIRVEKHGDTLCAYRVDNDKFLGQSATGKELVAHLKSIFDAQRAHIIIHTDDGAEYIKEYF